MTKLSINRHKLSMAIDMYRTYLDCMSNPFDPEYYSEEREAERNQLWSQFYTNAAECITDKYCYAIASIIVCSHIESLNVDNVIKCIEVMGFDIQREG